MTEEQLQRIAGALAHQNAGGHHPFSDGQGLLPAEAPTLPSAEQRREWRERTREYADGSRSHRLFQSDREKAVKRCCKGMDEALAEANPDRQVLRLAGTLRQQLQGSHFAMEPQGAAEQRRADMVLESLLAQENRRGRSLEPKQVLTAVASLSPELQRQLLQADRATGNRLWNRLEAATRDDPMSRQVYESVRPQANAAAALDRLDRRDPGGLESQLTKDFLRHLETSGVSTEGMAAVCDKLAFRTQMMVGHGDGADMPKLSAGDPHCRDKFTARLFSTLAELPRVSDEDLSRALTMPQDKLLVITGTSLGAMREGDVRLLAAIKDAAASGKEQSPELARLEEVIDKTQARQWSRLEAANPANLTGIDVLAAALETNAAQAHQATSQRTAEKLATVGGKMATHARHIRDTVLPDLQQQIGQARSDLVSGQASGPEAEAALRKLENKHQRLEGFAAQLEQASARITGMDPTQDKLLPVVERFGALDAPVDPFIGAGITPGTGGADSIKPRPFHAFIEFTKQVEGHLAGMENRATYAQGLANVAPVLPTAGRDLSQCPWLGSTVEDMARSARFVRSGPGAAPEFSLEQSPIVIIDQSDVRNQQLWDRNHQLCERLMNEHADTGLKIVHLSMADVERLAGPDTNKLFDASQSRNAGYGGARNMAYMIAPLIRHCENNNLDWRTMDAATARGHIQTQALQRNGTTLFMGDDTDLVTPGTLLAKAVVANVYCGADSEYTLVSQKRDGRDTMGVSEAQTNAAAVEILTTQGYDAFAANVFGSNKWNNSPKVAGMGCTAGDARFCLDLPLGAEERQHEALRNAIDRFSGSSHLSGDRQGELSTYLQGHLNYTHSSGMVKTLIMDSKACAWNSEADALDLSTGEARFENLGAVMEWASQPENVKLSQQAFFNAMSDWQANPPAGILSLDQTPAQFAATLPAGTPQRLFLEQSQEPTANAANVQFFINNNPQLANEERAQLQSIVGIYNAAGRQAGECKTYMNSLMDKLVPGPPPASQLPNDARKQALQAAVAAAPLAGPGTIAQMIQETRLEMEGLGVAFTADNRLMRDLHLATESVGGGGFARLAQNIRGPAPNLAVQIEPEVQQAVIAVNPPAPMEAQAEVFEIAKQPKANIPAKDKDAGLPLHEPEELPDDFSADSLDSHDAKLEEVPKVPSVKDSLNRRHSSPDLRVGSHSQDNDVQEQPKPEDKSLRASWQRTSPSGPKPGEGGLSTSRH